MLASVPTGPKSPSRATHHSLQVVADTGLMRICVLHRSAAGGRRLLLGPLLLDVLLAVVPQCVDVILAGWEFVRRWWT